MLSAKHTFPPCSAPLRWSAVCKQRECIVPVLANVARPLHCRYSWNGRHLEPLHEGPAVRPRYHSGCPVPTATLSSRLHGNATHEKLDWGEDLAAVQSIKFMLQLDGRKKPHLESISFVSQCQLLSIHYVPHLITSYHEKSLAISQHVVFLQSRNLCLMTPDGYLRLLVWISFFSLPIQATNYVNSFTSSRPIPDRGSSDLENVNALVCACTDSPGIDQCQLNGFDVSIKSLYWAGDSRGGQLVLNDTVRYTVTSDFESFEKGEKWRTGNFSTGYCWEQFCSYDNALRDWSLRTTDPCSPGLNRWGALCSHCTTGHGRVPFELFVSSACCCCCNHPCHGHILVNIILWLFNANGPALEHCSCTTEADDWKSFCHVSCLLFVLRRVTLALCMHRPVQLWSGSDAQDWLMPKNSTVWLTLALVSVLCTALWTPLLSFFRNATQSVKIIRPTPGSMF